ncbi:MAG TPA: type II toxin-antitoxin system HicA family toxin [Leptolyngbyaceae cyanobacterium]
MIKAIAESDQELCDRLYWLPYSGVELLGFYIVREREHIVMTRRNDDGTETPLVMPNHSEIKSGTLRAICTQIGISREEFLAVYEQT